MNKKDFSSNFGYFFKAILIAFIPIMVISFILTPYVSKLVLWLITFALIMVTLIIAYILKIKVFNKEKEEKKKNNKFDPFAD